MTFIQWMKRHRSAKVDSSAGSKFDNSDRRRRVLQRSETIPIDETLSSSTTTTEDAAAWRVENILVSGPPQDSDWWVESSEYSIDSEKLQDCDAPLTTDAEQTGRQFRNCGLETWEQGRSAWKNYDSNDASIAGRSAQSSGKPGLSKSQRRDLMKGLSTGRTYLLRQKVGLKDMVETYNMIWNDDLDE